MKRYLGLVLLCSACTIEENPPTVSSSVAAEYILPTLCNKMAECTPEDFIKLYTNQSLCVSTLTPTIIRDTGKTRTYYNKCAAQYRDMACPVVLNSSCAY